jgi:hypothetical protein
MARTTSAVVVEWLLRILGAAALGATAAIHAYLYRHYHYSSIHVIGVLFLLLWIGASAMCLAVLLAPRRILSLVAAAGAGLELSVIVGLQLFTHVTIFGFQDSTHAPKYYESLYVEIAGVIVLAALAALSFRSLDRRPGWAGHAAGH